MYHPPHKYLIIILSVASLCLGLARYLKSLVGALESSSDLGQTHTFGSVSNEIKKDSDSNAVGPNNADQLQNLQELDIGQLQSYLQDLKQQSDQLATYYQTQSGDTSFAQEIGNYMDQYYGQ